MARIQIDTPAPDFTLRDLSGHSVALSDFRGSSHALLVFNRGFT